MTLILFAALAGAIQMIAPDRWMPASVFAWQRGWRLSRIGAFTLLIFTIHVILGFVLYAALRPVFGAVSEENLGAFTLIFLGVVGTVRVLRFNRIREIMYRSPDARRVILTLLSLLGPSEMVIPILMKARLEGVPPLPALIPLWGGTCIAGLAIVLIARTSWNRPFMLPRVVQWCQSRIAVLPMSVGALIGVVFYLGSRLAAS